jgi:hypothetical protein
MGRIEYCAWLVLCDHGSKTGVLAFRALGWCAARRDLGGGRMAAYFLLLRRNLTHLGYALWPTSALYSGHR